MIEKITKIKVLVCDVDGVLTDGRIIYDNHGNELKNFNVYDGFGLVLLKKFGFKTAIITAKGSKVVIKRAKDLAIDKVYQDASPKIKAYEKMLRYFKAKDEQVCFVGDDLTDIGIMKRVGFAVSVPNAVQEVKSVAQYITKQKGGEGAVREVIELILKTQGHWTKVLVKYSS